ncbi:hypothetical protein [Caulobacter sp. 602-1]|uniref:hypothetical protein n=1 Tax=Caulobacter sp. 602-1 TaxID=2492472 RepID=UPI000F62E71F|nr:hypothetical protein [Caulobacter sp. 602-1]RRN63048.1 hypothetical protein EIK80_18090 [Caulobacter sp. 602-1]
MHAKPTNMRARHWHERLIIKAMRLLAAPAPGPSAGEELLRGAGMDEEGISALAAVVGLLPQMLPAARLHDIDSPFVSSGEILLLGELARRQRSAALRGALHWPLKLAPSLDRLLDASACALAAADLFLFYRTISAALGHAREMPSRGGAPATDAAPCLQSARHLSRL